ncbi:DUF2231 domain-containing protein [Rhodocaloribacter sp.]
MFSLPEWAPSIHPLLIHFPIALLTIAVLFDLVALVVPRKQAEIRSAAVALFTLGAVAALVAFFTGRAAADAVLVPAAAQTLLTDHADWAERTVWFYGLFALARLAMLRLDHKGRLPAGKALNILAFVIGAGGIFLLFQTGDRGAQMVFQYGLGVQAVPQEGLEPYNPDAERTAEGEADHEHAPGEEHEEAGAADHEHAPGEEHEEAGAADHEHAPGEEHEEESAMVMHPVTSEDGSWSWEPGAGARRALTEFRFFEGSPEDLSLEEQDGQLALTLEGGPVLFVTGDSLASIQGDVTLNLDRFNGSVRIVHHVHDAQNYNFLALEDGKMRQGRVRDGVTEIFDEEEQTGNDWFTLRVVADGTHFRGYVNGKLVVHGHSDAPAPGPVGLRLEGSGTVLLRLIVIQSLR